MKGKRKSKKNEDEGKCQGERIASAVRGALDVQIPDDMTKIRELLDREGIEKNIGNGIAYAMIIKALSGDRQAVEWVRETSGETNHSANNSGAVVFISGEEDIPE